MPELMPTTTRLITIDPSSTATGWAVLEMGRELTGEPTLIDCGVLRTPKLSAIDRIGLMCCAIEGNILEHEIPGIEIALVEIPAGRVHNRHQGGGSGLATYGMAAGAIWATMTRIMRCRDGRVEAITEGDWGRSKTKRQHQLRVQLVFPGYSPKGDAGMDCSDALAMALWWLDTQRMLRLAEGTGS